MPEKRGGLAGTNARGAVLSVTRDGTNYIEVPGISTASYTPGEAPSDTTVAWEGTRTSTGVAPVGNISFNVISYLQLHEAWQILRAAKTSGDPVSIRLDFPTRPAYGPSPSGTTVALAQTSVTAQQEGGIPVTFANQPEQWRSAIIQRGMTLSITGTDPKYIIRSISDANPAVVTVDPAPAPNTRPAVTSNNWPAVAAATYSVALSGLRYPLAATVSQLGGVEAGTEADISSTLVLTPLSDLPVPTIIT